MPTMKFDGRSGSGRDDRQGSNPFALLATIILAPVAAMLIQAAISRSREFDADAGGSTIAGGPNGLVSALRKIEVASKQIPLDANPATAHMFIIKPFSSSALLGLFSTHPPTADRIQAREETPRPLRVVIDEADIARVSVVVEGEIAVGDEDVISRELAPRTNPDRAKAGRGKTVEEGVGEDVTGSARKEDSVRQIPAPDRVFLDAGPQQVHG